jgi:hypothetical protein
MEAGTTAIMSTTEPIWRKRERLKLEGRIERAFAHMQKCMELRLLPALKPSTREFVNSVLASIEYDRLSYPTTANAYIGDPV